MQPVLPDFPRSFEAVVEHIEVTVGRVARMKAMDTRAQSFVVMTRPTRFRKTVRVGAARLVMTMIAAGAFDDEQPVGFVGGTAMDIGLVNATPGKRIGK